ncbi:cyclic dehypoxanthinyl futalosine synthase [Pelotomaculum propionicicum]|uniref:Cyclic dehypoxanthine futalosine synthase n=1 Tax=Pelotomaculum propionicicum TaxID=258475 RepID=A0A4Y7RVD4_9FIRM|nr:cyclic dehypoxanthinyl futalosine synthase [Pelotomaculum propionicicum]NLI13083.1 dehypoxanthine futalosine cyclase [Peptococcaceae bacterium]TEB12945.1 Cyclic dehypoxanthine futalosine synthase [Pelotomaculum propionicicum]
MTASIASKALEVKRLSEKEGLDLLRGQDLLTLGMLASQVRERLHPERRVTFVIDRNINYTNICVAGCRFCAFHRLAGHPEAYVLSREEIFHKIEETVAVGGTQILMQGGLNPDLDLKYFEDLFAAIKKRYPVKLHSLSPVEIDYLARTSVLPVEVVIRRLAAAGLDSIAGGGAEILVDRVRRQISPRKTSTGRWLEIMRAAHRAGLKSTATMMFGSVETLDERIAHLEAIRRLQDQTGGFTAFIPWSFQPGHTDLGGSPASSVDYLRTLAVSRIYLDNVPNLQVSWVTQGVKIAQVALAFGANDFGSTMLEENVVRAAGASFSASLQELVRSIKDAGYQPAQRDNLYNIIRTY